MKEPEMHRAIKGIVHGRTIELDVDPQLEDGSHVEILMRVNRLPGPPPLWKAGTSEPSAGGMMADYWTDEDDKILTEIYQDRHQDSRREPME
jgi:hypothetical protein